MQAQTSSLPDRPRATRFGGDLPAQIEGQIEGQIAGQTASSLRAGFTLVEMLVVLVIIGLIMGLVGPRVLNSLTDARAKAAKLQIEALGSSLDLYYLDVGRYPSSSEGLAALVAAPGGITGWNGPYLKGGTVPLDPWGQTYTYKSPGAAAPFEIVSFGSAGREGGGTEIRSQGKR